MIGVDLFAGAGGFTEGAESAGIQIAWAGNHWPDAVATHAANHPGTAHACQDMQQQPWHEVPGHDILLASPACQGHSPARGKEKPHHDATRSTAWAVVSCAEVHRPEIAVVENVPAFRNWVLFPAWSAAMNAIGYTLAPHILDAADYGVPQNRKRLIIVATRSSKPFELKPRTGEQPAIAPHLEWDQGEWRRIDRTLARATRERIENGRRAHGPRFLAPYYGSGSGLTGRSIHRPIGTITTRDRWAMVDGDRMRILSVDENKAAMGFRKDYRLPANKKLAKHMLGNAVPPGLARGVLEEIRARA